MLVLISLERRDVPPLVHVALAHAQFETIHPFSDGNGRTGRLLAQVMLRDHGVTCNVAVPVSAGLLSDLESYHEALTDYQRGDIVPIIEVFARAAHAAIPNCEQLIADLDAVRSDWLVRVRPRGGSVKSKLLDVCLRKPVFTAEVAAASVGVAVTNIYRDLEALCEAGILVQNREHRGPVLYRAPGVLVVIDAFAQRAELRA